MKSGLPAIPLVDSHAHLDSPQLLDQLEELLEEARAATVLRILTIGCVSTHADTLNTPLEIAKKHPEILAALGVHPHDAGIYSDKIGDRILKAMGHPEVVAWGEIGLDYHYQNSDSKTQINSFRCQLELALSVNKPVIIHSRAAGRQTCEILENYKDSGLKGVMHCFTYDQKTADRCLNLGFFLSFGGILTFANTRELQSIARETPSDRYLIETDSPYLAPVPFRSKTNRPAYVVKVAEKLADLRGIDIETVARESSQNFESLFGLS